MIPISPQTKMSIFVYNSIKSSCQRKQITLSSVFVTLPTSGIPRSPKTRKDEFSRLKNELGFSNTVSSQLCSSFLWKFHYGTQPRSCANLRDSWRKIFQLVFPILLSLVIFSVTRGSAKYVTLNDIALCTKQWE